jgi:hypothetical protein
MTPLILALRTNYDSRMVVRVVVAFLWLIAFAALCAAMRLRTSAIDIYIKDTYVVVTKVAFILLTLVVLVIPLVVTVRLLRPRHQ